MVQTRFLSGDDVVSFEVDYNLTDQHIIALRCKNNSVLNAGGKTGYVYAKLKRSNDPNNMFVDATFPPKLLDTDPAMVTTVAVPVAPAANQFNLVLGGAGGNHVTGVELTWQDNATPV